MKCWNAYPHLVIQMSGCDGAYDSLGRASTITCSSVPNERPGGGGQLVVGRLRVPRAQDRYHTSAIGQRRSAARRVLIQCPRSRVFLTCVGYQPHTTPEPAHDATRGQTRDCSLSFTIRSPAPNEIAGSKPTMTGGASRKRSTMTSARPVSTTLPCLSRSVSRYTDPETSQISPPRRPWPDLRR
jgi:hypothetical protein